MVPEHYKGVRETERRRRALRTQGTNIVYFHQNPGTQRVKNFSLPCIEKELNLGKKFVVRNMHFHVVRSIIQHLKFLFDSFSADARFFCFSSPFIAVMLTSSITVIFSFHGDQATFERIEWSVKSSLVHRKTRYTEFQIKFILFCINFWVVFFGVILSKLLS